MTKYLKLFSNCILVKGVGRCAIYDLQRKQIFFIPISLYKIFDKDSNSININEVTKILNIDSKKIFDEYLEFLIKNEIAFYCNKDELIHFPNLNNEWIYPSHITNCIIDSNSTELKYFDSSFLSQLELLCCNYIQFRFFKQVRIEELYSILNRINSTQIKSIELITPIWKSNLNDSEITELIEKNRKIRTLILTNAIKDKTLKKEDFLTGAIYLTKKEISDFRHCGVVDIKQFAINIPHYTESLAHNTCLNRKIAIDTEGNIKNCPSMKESFGNIRDTTLEEAVNKPGFKKYWNITKDQITKCKDCEFRHVCTDCRAYIDNPNDIYSAPLKCGYDTISY